MKAISLENVGNNLQTIVREVNEGAIPVVIVPKSGQSAVLVGEDDWRAIEETLYLSAIPGMTESLLEGMEEPLDECIDEEDVVW